MKFLVMVSFLVSSQALADWQQFMQYQKEQRKKAEKQPAPAKSYAYQKKPAYQAQKAAKKERIMVGGQWVEVTKRKDQRFGKYQKSYASGANPQYAYPLLPYFASEKGESESNLDKIRAKWQIPMEQSPLGKLGQSFIDKYAAYKGFTPDSGVAMAPRKEIGEYTGERSAIPITKGHHVPAKINDMTRYSLPKDNFGQLAGYESRRVIGY